MTKAHVRGDASDARQSPAVTAADLEALYEALNRRENVHPDPLEFVYRFGEPRDREVAGFVAAALAFGRVASILASVERVLSVMGPSPAGYVAGTPERTIRSDFAGFRHRWTRGEELADLLLGIRGVLERHGSLERCFARGMGDDETVLPALDRFVGELSATRSRSSLLACPEDGSACKRMNLFLRWMVRSDDVDPGCWTSVPPRKLVVPLDTHMHRICLAWGLTGRATPNLATALDVTTSFRRFAPDDPVRYDFAITRLGMRGGVDGLSLRSAVAAVAKAARGGRKGR